jgi:hypothetical protein
MVDACFARWRRLPNYINADFWEVPADGLIDATVYMNQRLHAIPSPVLRIENGRAITRETDHGRLLRGNAKRAGLWIDQHLGEICPPLDPEQPGPVVHQLTGMVNLALIVSILNAVLPPDETQLRTWTGRTLRELARYLLDIEPRVLAALDADSGALDGLAAIPYFLLEASSPIGFDVTSAVRGGPAAGPADTHDHLLLAGLAGRSAAIERLAERLTASREALSAASSTARLYDLTHEILYLALLRPDTVKDPALAGQLGKLLADVLAANQDLGAELLACYWIIGGTVADGSRAAARLLKAASEQMPAECAADREGHCRCPQFKEQVHSRLTMTLGLGVTLATAGELLDGADTDTAGPYSC